MSSSDDGLNEIFTSCLGCVFSEQEGFRQTGCKLNRLEKFQAFGNAVEAYNENGDEFFIIDDRICFARRGDFWSYERKGKDLEEEVNRELRLKLDLVVNFDDGPLELLHRTILNFDNPNKVIVLSSNRNIPISKTLFFLRDNLGETKWILEDLKEDMGPLEKMNLAAKKCEGHYFTYVNAGFTITQSIFGRLNNYVNIQLHQLSLVCPFDDKYNLLTCSVPLFNKLGGNSSKSILTKAYELAAEQTCENLILTFEDFIDATD